MPKTPDAERLSKSPHAVEVNGRLLMLPSLHKEWLALQKKAEGYSIGVGELVHVLTDYLGIPQCAPCQRRQKFLDRLRINADRLPWQKLLDKVYELRGEQKKITVTWLD